ncbi:MAG TPA: hypothetical protein VM305_04095 [Candidatus Limnocylindrales bacterium]|nr:hypothetical protein [Candidatus Limnocylindrales bacterium]
MVVNGVLLLAACTPTPVGVLEAPPDRGPATETAAASAGLCTRLAIGEVEAAVRSRVSVVAEASGREICTFLVGDTTDDQYHVTVRIEDLFEELAAAEAVFPGGTRLTGTSHAGYWAPAVQTLWVDAGERLYAVQLARFAEGADRALEIALALVRLIDPTDE